ncbi:guanine nucleotide exchange factor synembryn [Drepanopeziza brunnea f. sp. 'multigermtubi' MB_m1]|uniref:Guanine nucleotide exchange factor synembryn n=1 Tax=Marssonina brunnea f. sp. multigermtubi (strain MB_m1) TaxID=1072389 RepID=K1WIG5_MARBU|nr:guanine nucleotide exchange factor synembryn [Drepanopeziza brunnea f. sp. 'multigermtubi' MB_m1]EKD12611.1 guanine nucleotide exchange factor synembryn [Drepanopeziza brunnea f. sp. 'multigermtubi' MB_m1]
MATPSVELKGTGKLDEVTSLMGKLTADLEKISLLPHQRDAILEQVKVHGRDPTDSDPIFTREAKTLSRHAFNSPSLTTSRNALRVLANALLLKPETRQIFVDLGFEQKACNKLKNDSRDDEFLISRILFLSTYDTNLDLQKLIDDYHLAENICQNIGRNSKQYVTKQKKVKEVDPMEEMALIEMAKLMFNITHYCPQRIGAFSPAIQPMLIILTKRTIPSGKPLEPPIGSLVNALMNLDLEHKDNVATLFPKATPNVHITRLVELLEKSVKVYTEDELEHNVSPLLTVIRKVLPLAPKDVQTYLGKLLLPSEEDRKQVLGRTETLPSRLLRLTNNPLSPQVRESVSALLFELSNKDARTFVQNVGYGFASGFLFQHNVPIPENALEAWSTSSEGSNTRASQDSMAQRVNPITGQLLDMEEHVEMEEMTEEEKEREAEKLFVLFERLKKTGVMDVQNPVAKAYSEGRLQELPDDAESD